MKKSLILICFLPFLVHCVHRQKAVIASQLPPVNDTIHFKVEKEFNTGTTATFEFISYSQNSITIFGPWLKKIEKFEEGTWRKIKILNCPCGANCSPPPKTLVLQPSKKHIVEWNLLESWCDTKQQNEIPLTIEKQSLPGLYRISLDYSMDGIEQKRITKEFNIIN